MIPTASLQNAILGSGRFGLPGRLLPPICLVPLQVRLLALQKLTHPRLGCTLASPGGLQMQPDLKEGEFAPPQKWFTRSARSSLFRR